MKSLAELKAIKEKTRNCCGSQASNECVYG